MCILRIKTLRKECYNILNKARGAQDTPDAEERAKHMYINETSAREYLHIAIDVLEGRTLHVVHSLIGAMIRQDDELAKRIGKKIMETEKYKNA